MKAEKPRSEKRRVKARSMRAERLPDGIAV